METESLFSLVYNTNHKASNLILSVYHKVPTFFKKGKLVGALQLCKECKYFSIDFSIYAHLHTMFQHMY